MQANVRWIGNRAGDGAVNRSSPFHPGALLAGALAVILVALVLRGGLPRARLDLAVMPGAPDAPVGELTAFAARTLEGALTKGGGVSFEIVQTSTITARAGGPLVSIPDPVDPTKPLGKAEQYVVGTLVERGFATSHGYWMELIHGPEPGAADEYQLDKAQVSRQALVRDGITFRNDGNGWHETDILPGIGLDPATLTGLPRLVAKAADGTDVPLEAPRLAPNARTEAIDPAAVPVDADLVAATLDGLEGPETGAVRALAAHAVAADLPGVIAPDLALFTELVEPVELRFDEGGRLVGLRVLARNTHLEVHDLLVDTVVSLRYPAAPTELPAPEPRYVEPALDPDAATEEED